MNFHPPALPAILERPFVTLGPHEQDHLQEGKRMHYWLQSSENANNTEQNFILKKCTEASWCGDTCL